MARSSSLGHARLMKPVLVSPADLSPDALRNLVDAFVLREGTDYGHGERSLDDKRAEVVRQLDRGDVVIVFDTELEEVNLLLRRDLPADVEE